MCPLLFHLSPFANAIVILHIKIQICDAINYFEHELVLKFFEDNEWDFESISEIWTPLDFSKF